jgi:uncharacterized protein (TIGR02246 family)
MTISKKFFISLFLFTSQIIVAQNDEKEIEKQVSQLVSDWNTHAFKNMDNYTTEDVEWINIIGMWWKGRMEVKMAHQGMFDAIFKGVPFTKKSTKIRFLTSNVAVANLIVHVGEFFPPDGINHGDNKRPEADDLLTLIYVKKNDKWLLSAGQNTVISFDERATEILKK